MRCHVTYSIESLPAESSRELFRRFAFSHGGVLETETFVVLGRSMVEKCGGLPLAIKTLGVLLHSKKSEQEWLSIQNSEIWKSERVLPSLRLSYDNLPYSSLKQCFAYCSIMPKDTEIYKDELIQIWMALGFLLPPSGSNALMEDIGNEYFNILLWNSLLQEGDKVKLGNVTYYKMHDLVHDLALDLSNYHSIIEKDGHILSHNSKAIYVRLDKGDSDLKPTTLRRNFESVQLLNVGDCILDDVLPFVRHLTVLVLNSDEVIYKLPSSLRKIKYLKYLDISCFHSTMPNHISELYNLQTLRVWNLEELPKIFCNLIYLRHLVIKEKNMDRNGSDTPRCIFTGIERLTCLQTLPHFVVNRDRNCLIGQLGGLNLRGKLDLYGLGDVANMEEASNAKLWSKPNIHCLLLDWSNNEDDREDRKYNHEEVMEGLTPHANLKKLTIVNFKGKKLSSWITMMTNLVEITVIDSNRCEGFPPLGHLPKLRKIKIDNMKNVKVIGGDIRGGDSSRSEFSESRAQKTANTMYPSLIKLILWDLPNLEEWREPVMSSGGEDQNTPLVFPKIEILDILNCSKLTRIPMNSFTSLKQLLIQDLDSSNMILESMSRNVSSLRYLHLSRISDGKGDCSYSSKSLNVDSISNKLLENNSLSLRSFEIHQCTGLRCLTLGVALEQLEVCHCPELATISVDKDSGGLKYLRIASCPSLSEWVFVQSMSSTLVQLVLGPFLEELEEFPWPFSSSSAAVISFPKLKDLNLHGWDNVKSILPSGQIGDRLASTFPALTELGIHNFDGLKALPDSLAKLPCLRDLCIFNCENLCSLPTFDKFNSPRYMEISGCAVLTERCRKEVGPEWFKIQHIPHIDWFNY
ncbi:NB-ARC domain-containing protein [Heracleum sosnowskyi]|uniref:NB-ARC domain-containing protein n=1 Tax=Heracleum sosnowskyi TaxID=360622 RepID=A0AAD8HEB1_9APIA|nr:NB-ARC domain-containing protein [Heracleum sosnowskyi]